MTKCAYCSKKFSKSNPRQCRGEVADPPTCKKCANRLWKE